MTHPTVHDVALFQTSLHLANPDSKASLPVWKNHLANGASWSVSCRVSVARHNTEPTPTMNLTALEVMLLSWPLERLTFGLKELGPVPTGLALHNINTLVHDIPHEARFSGPVWPMAESILVWNAAVRASAAISAAQKVGCCPAGPWEELSTRTEWASAQRTPALLARLIRLLPPPVVVDEQAMTVLIKHLCQNTPPWGAALLGHLVPQCWAPAVESVSSSARQELDDCRAAIDKACLKQEIGPAPKLSAPVQKM